MASTTKRFRAFISYSQRDKAVARRLHKALETYRLPGGVRAEGVDAKSRRVGRIFRDDDEMGASADLGATLRGALEDTEALIVVCSRRSAKSQWVNQEIAHFKRTGRADRIFAVIIDGAPNAARESDQCFPPALRFEVDASGAVTDTPSEPLGLDMRVQSFERVRVRLIAGLLGLPFDDLWNRDRRRRRRNTAIGVGTSVAAAAAVSIAGAFWLKERVDRTLVEARADFGEGRISQGLARLRPHVKGPFASAVDPTLRSILGWATPISEQMAQIGRPRVISYRGAVLLVDSAGGLHDVSEIGGAPQRVLLSRDERRLVIVGENKTLVLDPATGAKLSDAENNSTDWISHAFETPEGRLVILGTRFGSTNGAIWHAALTVSADGASTQRIDLTQLVALRSVWLGGACEVLMIATRSDEMLSIPLTASGVLHTNTQAAADAQLQSATQVWELPPGGNPFEDSLFNTDAAQLQTMNPFAEIGCESAAADTGAGDLEPAIVNVAQLGAFGAPEEWTPISEPPPLFRELPEPQGQEPGAWGFGSWRSLPAPMGVAPDSPEFDAVNGTALAFIEDRANAGVRWGVCRADGECVETAAMHDGRRSYELVRSHDGAYLLIAHAGQIVDLGRLRLVTGVRDLPTEQGAAYDFEPDRAQITFIVDGELIAYRPGVADGGWTRVEEISGASFPRSDAGFAGLVALGGGEYLVVSADGAATRVDGAGRTRWQVRYAGLGPLLGVRYSRDRNFVALVSVAGMRVIDARTGLVLSPVLTPDGWPDNDEEAAHCLSGVHVSNAGAVRVVCVLRDGGSASAWSPRTFTGDAAARISAMLCDADAGLSAVAALTRCLDDQ